MITLIGSYKNDGFKLVADGINDFFERRKDLQTRGISFGSNSKNSSDPYKISTDISLISIDRSDPEAFALSEVILRGVNAGLRKYLEDRPILEKCCPEQSLFVNPIFNLQRYAPGEGFIKWHCDWTISNEVTEPSNRVLAWILYCNDVDSGGTEFHWQEHHETAERGKLIIFPAGISHIHRGRVNTKKVKTIATGWINAGSIDSYIDRLAKSK